MIKKLMLAVAVVTAGHTINGAGQAPTSPEKRFCADTAAIDQDPTLGDLELWLENLEDEDEEGCTVLDNLRNTDLRQYLLLKKLKAKIEKRIKLEKLRMEVREELRAEQEALRRKIQAEQAAQAKKAAEQKAQEQQQYADSVAELCQSLEEFE